MLCSMLELLGVIAIAGGARLADCSTSCTPAAKQHPVTHAHPADTCMRTIGALPTLAANSALGACLDMP